MGNSARTMNRPLHVDLLMAPSCRTAPRPSWSAAAYWLLERLRQDRRRRTRDRSAVEENATLVFPRKGETPSPSEKRRLSWRSLGRIGCGRSMPRGRGGTAHGASAPRPLTGLTAHANRKRRRRGDIGDTMTLPACRAHLLEQTSAADNVVQLHRLHICTGIMVAQV
jgi:hypothetical protein